jgi:hypothetical protein
MIGVTQFVVQLAHEVGECVSVGEIVDGHEIQRRRIHDDLERRPADPAQSVNGNVGHAQSFR